MTNKLEAAQAGTVGSWAKRCYLAGRAAMDNVLRPLGLGSTQWYVLYYLAERGPTMQRELVRILQVERATLSVIVATLARKGLVEQVPDAIDQRQKLLRLTPAGSRLWGKLPDLTFIHDVAFDGIDDASIATAASVLRTATERLENLLLTDNSHDSATHRRDRARRRPASSPTHRGRN